jgi:hypothetical protein
MMSVLAGGSDTYLAAEVKRPGGSCHFDGLRVLAGRCRCVGNVEALHAMPPQLSDCTGRARFRPESRVQGPDETITSDRTPQAIIADGR